MNALVLSGGAAHGAYEAGVAKALAERERYDMICGVSIGAVNAALIAAGRTDDALERFWLEEMPANALTLFPHLPRLRRLMNQVSSLGTGGWEDAVRLARAATEIPFLTKLGNRHKAALPAVARSLGNMLDFARLHASLLIGATNVTYATAAVFRASFRGALPPPGNRGHLTEYYDLTQENFVDALLASSAMPGLLSPIELSFDGKPALYADGSLVHTSPLGLAVENGATQVTVVFVDQELDPQTATAAQTLTQQAYNIATLWQQRLLDYELRLAEATNELIALGGAAGKRRISIRYVRPSQPIEIDLLAFDDAPALARLFERGLADGAAGPNEVLPEVEPIDDAQLSGNFWDAMRRLFPRKSPA